jgi:hypothetical protein
MALQRTRALAFARVRSLPSVARRSPLNAYPFGASPKLIGVALLSFLYSPLVSAAPAVRLALFAPCLEPQPQPCYFATVNPGISFPIGIAAVDEKGAVDRNYTGTIAISTTDPFATYPSSYTFLPADHGVHVFLNAFALRTLGDQTIMATDVAGQLASGSLTLTVVLGVPPEPIPSLTTGGVLVFGVALVIAGGFLARSVK